jgi:hypothetical protein
MKRVLILESELSQSIALAKYIRTYSDFYVVGGCSKILSKCSRYFHKVIKVDYNTEEFTDYDYIVPTGAESTFQLLSKRNKFCFENSIHFCADNLIVYKKDKMLSIANDVSVPIPNTYYSRAQIKEYPIFYKEDFERGGGVRGVAFNSKEIPSYESLIYQEFINTPSTYGVGFLAKDGEVLTYTIHKEVISYPQSGGSSVVIEEYEDERLIDYTKKLVKVINYNGWGLAEYKYCNTRDDYVFMEINSKMWASIEFLLKNNERFLKLLFDISYSVDKVTPRILFFNRFLLYRLRDLIKYSKYLFISSVISERSIINQLALRITPVQIKSLVKKYYVQNKSS